MPTSTITEQSVAVYGEFNSKARVKNKYRLIFNLNLCTWCVLFTKCILYKCTLIELNLLCSDSVHRIVYTICLGKNMCFFLFRYTESEKNAQRTVEWNFFFFLLKLFNNYSYNIRLDQVNDLWMWKNIVLMGKPLFEFKRISMGWECQAKISLMLTPFFVHKTVHTVRSHLDVLAKNRLGAISIQCWESLQFIETKSLWVDWSKKRRRRRNERETETAGKKEHRMKHVTILLKKYRWTTWTLTSNDVLVHSKRSHSNCDPIETHWNNNERV